MNWLNASLWRCSQSVATVEMDINLKTSTLLLSWWKIPFVDSITEVHDTIHCEQMNFCAIRDDINIGDRDYVDSVSWFPWKNYKMSKYLCILVLLPALAFAQYEQYSDYQQPELVSPFSACTIRTEHWSHSTIIILALCRWWKWCRSTRDPRQQLQRAVLHRDSWGEISNSSGLPECRWWKTKFTLERLHPCLG